MAIYKGEQCLAGVGKNATIKIGTAKTGTSAAVTNSGTDTDAILNFTLPKGDQELVFQVLSLIILQVLNRRE